MHLVLLLQDNLHIFADILKEELVMVFLQPRQRQPIENVIYGFECAQLLVLLVGFSHHLMLLRLPVIHVIVLGYVLFHIQILIMHMHMHSANLMLQVWKISNRYLLQHLHQLPVVPEPVLLAQVLGEFADLVVAHRYDDL